MTSPHDTSPAARGARRRERTRTAILDAAEHLLGSDSGGPMKIEDVAEHAGVSPASIYVHFGTKDALVAATQQRLLAVVSDTLLAAYGTEGDALSQVRASGLAYIQLLLDHPALTRYLTVQALVESESNTRQDISDQIGVLRGQFEERIQAAIDLAQISPLDSRLLSYFLFGAWNGVALLALRHDAARLSRSEIEQATELAIELMSQGMQVGTSL